MLGLCDIGRELGFACFGLATALALCYGRWSVKLPYLNRACFPLFICLFGFLGRLALRGKALLLLLFWLFFIFHLLRSLLEDVRA